MDRVCDTPLPQRNLERRETYLRTDRFVGCGEPYDFLSLPDDL